MTAIAQTRPACSREATTKVDLLDVWFDPIEERVARLCGRVHPGDDQGRTRSRRRSAACTMAASSRRRKRSVPMGEAMSPATGMAIDRAL